MSKDLEKSDEKDEVVLTDRELAIARGEDPDVQYEEEEEETEEGEDEPIGGEGNQPQDQAEDKGEEKGDWINETVRSFAQQHGLTTEDLEGFDSFDQFDKAVKIISKLDRPESGKEDEEASDDQEEGEEEGESAIEKIDPAEYEDEYDEATNKLVKHVRHSQDRLEAMEKRLQKREQELEATWEEAVAQQQMTQINAYHDVVDRHRPSFYGKTIDANGNPVKLDKQHGERRQKLFEAVEQVAQFHAERQKKAGEEVSLPGYETLVQEAEQLAFGKELKEHENRSRGQRLRKQSNRRRGVGAPHRSSDVSSSSTVTEPANEFEIAAEIALDPDIVSFTNK